MVERRGRSESIEKAVDDVRGAVTPLLEGELLRVTAVADLAQAVYRICQAQDQAWREKRRIRELEELRARSGGIQVLSGQGAPGSAQSEAVRRLQEAKQLLDAKLITDAEYEAIKAKIVSF